MVRDSKFWQAWERSAFLFSKLFRPFKINARFFLEYLRRNGLLGLPGHFAKIQEECDGKYCYQTLDSDHVVISCLPAVENFIEWNGSVSHYGC